MRSLMLVAALLLLPLSATAGEMQSRKLSDEISVNYRAYPSTELAQDIAVSVGLVRDGHTGLVQIAPLRGGEPLLSSLVRGKVRTQQGDSTSLQFIRVADVVASKQTVSFIATYPIPEHGLLNFEIRISTPRGAFDLEFGEEVQAAD